MPTPQNAYNEIRALLSRYYDGLTAPDENKFLTEFFSSADVAELPADLAEEAPIFRMLSGHLNDAVVVPSDLEARVRTVSCGTPRRKRHVIVRYSVPAAAAAVAAIMAMTWMRSDDRAMLLPATDNIVPTVAVAVPAVTVEDDYQAYEQSDAVMSVIPETAQKSRVKTEPDELPDNYIEITNQQQASILVQDALALVREKLAVAGYSIGSASDGLRQIDNALSDIIMD